MINVYVPTYKRQQPRALELAAKDNNVAVCFCVRHEELEKGYYNIPAFQKDNIKLIDLGSNVIDLGDTRQRILDYCRSHNEQYCIMLDDTVSDIYDLYSTQSISECLTRCIDQMKENTKLNVMFALSTEQRKHHAQDINSKYFLHCPAQGFIIDVNLAHKHNITFKPLSICGIEDMAFFIDTIKAGLLTCTNRQINMIVETTLKQKKGGTHTDSYSVEDKCDIYNTGLAKYAGEMYGVYFTKRYRHQIESQCCFAAFDYEYLQDVLIKYRDENKQIIDSQFQVRKLERSKSKEEDRTK